MSEPFTDFRLAARLLLTVTTLNERTGQFLGGLCFRNEPLTDKQANWLRILLDRHNFPPLADGGEHG